MRVCRLLPGPAAAATSAFALAAFIGLPSAFAQNAGAAQKAFDEGKAAFDAGNCEAALPKLALSDKLEPGSGTKVLLATCYERTSKFASAYNSYLAAADAYRAAKKQERVDYAMARAKELEPKLQLLKIEAKEKPADLRLKLDGQDLLTDTIGFEQPIDSGEHVLMAYAAGKKVFQTTVVIAFGKKLTVAEIVLENAPADYVPPAGTGVTPVRTGPVKETVELSGNGAARSVGWVMVGVGGAGLATGLVFVVLRNGAQAQGNLCQDADIRTADTDCKNPSPGIKGSSRRGDIVGTFRDTASTYTISGAISAGVGLALVTTGIILVATSGSKAQTTTRVSEGVRVTPVVGWNSVGLTGTF